MPAGDAMVQSSPIYACTRANNARYSSVHITFCGREKNLTGRKCQAHGAKSGKTCREITLFKTTRRKAFLLSDFKP